MLCWITKLRIIYIASKDANIIYDVNNLSKELLYKNHNTSNNIEFQPTNWMTSLVDNYINTVNKLINNKKSIITLYTKIKIYYSKFKEANNEFSNKKSEIETIVSNIQADIKKIECEIDNKSKLLEEFYQGKPILYGLTPRKLINSKNDLYQKCAQKKVEMETLSDMSTIKSSHDTLTKELRNNVRQLESNFSEKIDALYRKICKIQVKYNEKSNYYCKKLSEYIQKMVEYDIQPSKKAKNNTIIEKVKYYNKTIETIKSIKQSKDIASLCNKDLPSKEDLFKNERSYINTTINKDMDIYFEV